MPSVLLQHQQQFAEFYFVRPGQTADNLSLTGTKQWSGPDDTSLNEKGKQQANEIANIFQNVVFDMAVHTSAKRTEETANIILQGKKVKKIEKRDEFCEMEIGLLGKMNEEEIINFFCKETGYPHINTLEKLPKIWSLYGTNKNDMKANDVLLDSWHHEIDTFDNFTQKFLPKFEAFVREVTKKDENKKVLVVSQGTPMKIVFGIANKGHLPQNVNCAKGSYYVVKIGFNEIGELVVDKPIVSNGVEIKNIDSPFKNITGVK